MLPSEKSVSWLSCQSSRAVFTSFQHSTIIRRVTYWLNRTYPFARIILGGEGGYLAGVSFRCWFWIVVQEIQNQGFCVNGGVRRPSVVAQFFIVSGAVCVMVIENPSATCGAFHVELSDEAASRLCVVALRA